MIVRRSYNDRITDAAARQANDDRKAKAAQRAARRLAIQPDLDVLAAEADAAFAAGDEDAQREISRKIAALLDS